MNLIKVSFIAAMTFFMSLQQAFCMPIENVNVKINDISGKTSKPLVSKMSDSIQIVADQILLDKDTVSVNQYKTEYGKLFEDIGDRVLTGYEVHNVQLTLGSTTEVMLDIIPWNETIDNVEIDLQFSGIDKQTATYMETMIPDLRERLHETIKGASVDAEDWAGGILRRIVRQEIEKSLPEFKAAVDLICQEDKTIVQVIIYPVGQVVSDVKYEMHSESIPNILLNKLKVKYQQEVRKLRGLPVSYLQNHKQDYEKYLMKKLMLEDEVSQYDLKPQIAIIPDASTSVDIVIYSDDYKIWFEGYTDIGRDKNNISGKAHLGKYISDKDEVFTEAEIVLDDVQWNLALGYTYSWGKSYWTYMHRMPHKENNYKLEYDLNNKWRLRAEHYSKKNRSEYGIRYRIHEFLSAEYVYGGDEFYLRLIGNL